MPAPENRFKTALLNDRLQVGCWLALASPYSAEAIARAGFDWLLIDGEHAPNDIPLILGQLQAIAPSPASAVVRIPVGETWIIKQVLDLGCQTILVPMVESAEQARMLAAAMHYPPRGVRGIGSALARASQFAGIADYLATADDQVCLLVQVESRRGLAAIEEIAAVDGIDGIFVGPSDLAADMGRIGQPSHPEVKAAVEDAIRRIRACGKPAGVLAFDQAVVRGYIALGASFPAVSSDVTILTSGARQLAASFKA